MTGLTARAREASRRAAPTPASQHYWLMDSQTAYVLSYDDSGVMTQVEARTSQPFIRDCCRWRDDALSEAIPVRDYMTMTMRKESGC